MPNVLSDRIIVALDVPGPENAIALVDRLPEVHFWKVGLELFVSGGPAILSALKERGKRIFLDLKFHDIPNTMVGACHAAAKYGADLLTVHATAGKPALEAALEACDRGAAEAGILPPKMVAVTLLTSIDTRQLAFDLKVPLDLDDYVLQLALLARAAGLAGVVCSPQEAASLRDRVSRVEHMEGNAQKDRELILVCPGIRPSGSGSGDQRRTLTPKAAFQAGATYLVIGRPIVAATDPALAWHQLCDELV